VALTKREARLLDGIKKRVMATTRGVEETNDNNPSGCERAGAGPA
jgi:hypothetical protein